MIRVELRPSGYRIEAGITRGPVIYADGFRHSRRRQMDGAEASLFVHRHGAAHRRENHSYPADARLLPAGRAPR